LKEKYKARV